jgi:hypothetical protein
MFLHLYRKNSIYIHRKMIYHQYVLSIWYGNRRWSDEISLESVDERWNGSPLLIKHKSNLIDDDKQQRDRI